MPLFRIQGLNRSVLRYVRGKDKAIQAAVDEGMVTGRKKIFAITKMPEGADPYDQSFEDM